MKFPVYCVVLALLVFGCTDPENEQLEELKNETIAIHDEIMPRMEEIMAAKKNLRQDLKALQSDTTINQDSISQIYSTAISNLEQADEAMMEWMRNYSKLMDREMEADSAIKAFENEKKEIQRVKVLMNGSIDDANALLAK